MLQRLGIAATVVGRPELLLLDEPASALDPAGRREVLNLLGELRGHATVLLSSHILADVEEVCDTVGGDLMNLWRLEWVRLLRTHRLLALVGIYLFFGLTGPLTARYLSANLGQVGTEGVRIEFPDPVPADGIAQFVGNTSQVGLLVVVLVAASALAFDARREMAVFLRTRVRAVRDIVIPAYVVNAGAAIAGLAAGTAAAWYETTVLLGGVPAAAMLAGLGLASLFSAFAVALTAAVASVLRGVAVTAGVALATLVSMAILGRLTPLGRWLPTHLAGAMTELVRGGSPIGYLPAAAVSVAATAAAVILAVALNARREV